jgi:hypothetical protein
MSISPRSILYKTCLGLTLRNAIVGNFTPLTWGNKEWN